MHSLTNWLKYSSSFSLTIIVHVFYADMWDQEHHIFAFGKMFDIAFHESLLDHKDLMGGVFCLMGECPDLCIRGNMG